MQGPGCEPVNALAQGGQLGRGWPDEGEVIREGVAKDLFRHVDPAYKAEAVPKPGGGKAPGTPHTTAVAKPGYYKPG